jgi:lipoate-protein ligase A
MAVDDALLATAAAGGPATLRLYRWAPACLSVGRNQVIRGRLDGTRLARRGWQLVRRATGGLAVLHDAEITYAVTAPMEAVGGPREAYRRISGALAAALRSLDLDAAVAAAPAGAPARPGRDDARCFAGTAPGEVCVGRRKILGSAQRRSGSALLQHGSLLLRGSQDVVGDLVPPAPRGPGLKPEAASERAARQTTVEAELGTVPPDGVVVAAIVTAFAAALGVCPDPMPLTPAERSLADERERVHGSEAWVWRR